MTQMFCLELHPHTDTGFYFSYTHVWDQISGIHIKLEEEKTVITPSDEITDQGQTPDTGRPPFTLVRDNFSQGSASFGRLAVQTTLVHCPSLNYQMNRKSSCWFSANPSHVLQPKPAELLFASMVTCRVLEIGCDSDTPVLPPYPLSVQNTSTTSGPMNRSCP